jgi:mono/diheme cytochrome c family protein
MTTGEQAICWMRIKAEPFRPVPLRSRQSLGIQPCSPAGTARAGARFCENDALPVLSAAAFASLAACADASEPPDHLRIADANPERGRELIAGYGCGACHRIEGVRGTRGTVGPPLTDYAQRKLLAGIVPNTPRMLVAWIMDPPAMSPQTGMPAVGVSEPEARHIASYLYTLGAARSAVYPPDPPLNRRGQPGAEASGPILAPESLPLAQSANTARGGKPP